MLLDRRKVKFWQKIVFGFMAFLMAAFLVVGYSGVLNGCTWFQSSQESAVKTLDEAIAKYKTAIAADVVRTLVVAELIEEAAVAEAIERAGGAATIISAAPGFTIETQEG